MVLAIYCAGGLGREIIEVVKSVNVWENVIYVDDIIDKDIVDGIEVYRFEEVGVFGSNIEFLIANGEPDVRRKLFNKVKIAGYKFSTLYCPGCSILSNVAIGEGCVIYDCGLSTAVKIDSNCYINSKVIIGHDSCIGKNCVISPNVFIGGNCKIGDNVFIGPGVMVKDSVTVGDNSILVMGAIILRNVKSKSVMLGNPAKRICENENNMVFKMF